MSRRKRMKKSLIATIGSIGLCLAMLIGTTLAWFSDNTAGVRNKFVAGNLNVELYNTTGDGETLVQGDTPLFGENVRWEPGHAKFVNLRLDNTGTLALKYQLSIHIAEESGSKNVFGADFYLSDYMYYAAVEGRQTYTDDPEGWAKAIAAAQDAGAAPISERELSYDGRLYPTTRASDEFPCTKEVTLIVYMAEDNENQANTREGDAAPAIDLGVTLSAAQISLENDSFGADFDANVDYPAAKIGNTYYDSLQEAVDAAGGLETVVLSRDVQLTEGMFAAQTGTKLDLNRKTLGTYSHADNGGGVLAADGAVISNGTIQYSYDGDALGTQQYAIAAEADSSVTIENVVLDCGGFANQAVQASAGATVVFKNCEIKNFGNGQLMNFSGTLVFENCTLEGSLVNTIGTVTLKNTTVQGTLYEEKTLSGFGQIE